VALTITSETMRGTKAKHTTSACPTGWPVTWLPDRLLRQDQAVTAMQLAEVLDSSETLEGGLRQS
jgi:hypothetical protein